MDDETEPRGWEPELDELRRREELAKRMGGEERVERQHASGRLTVRERIDRLFDDGTFHETGALAGRGHLRRRRRAGRVPARELRRRAGPDRRPAGGRRRATTSPCAAAPPTRRSGRSWSRPSAWRTSLRLPLVRLVDGTGGGGSVKTLETMGFTYVPPLPGFELLVANLDDVSRSSPPRSGRWPASAPRASSPRTSA